jgi:hypothetical protein
MMDPIVWQETDNELCLAALLQHEEETAAAALPILTGSKFIDFRDDQILKKYNISFSKQVSQSSDLRYMTQVNSWCPF